MPEPLAQLRRYEPKYQCLMKGVHDCMEEEKKDQPMNTFIAKRSPVVLFLAKKTRPNAPRLIGFMI